MDCIRCSCYTRHCAGQCLMCCHVLVLTVLRQAHHRPWQLGNLSQIPQPLGQDFNDAGNLPTDTVFFHSVTLLIAVALFWPVTLLLGWYWLRVLFPLVFILKFMKL